MPANVQTTPFGLNAWKVIKGGKQVGTIQKVMHECHCANFGKWKFFAYNLHNQQVGIAQFNLTNARNLFKTR